MNKKAKALLCRSSIGSKTSRPPRFVAGPGQQTRKMRRRRALSALHPNFYDLCSSSVFSPAIITYLLNEDPCCSHEYYDGCSSSSSDGQRPNRGGQEASASRVVRGPMVKGQFLPPSLVAASASGRDGAPRCRVGRGSHQLCSSNQPAFARPLLLKQDLQSDWPHVGAFQLDHLLHRYGGREFVVGSDDETGEDITLRLSDYLEYYCATNTDDSPLYIFDDGVLCGDDDDSSLKASYAIPPCFPDDYMACWMNERPPYCWLLMGAPRSGTAWHVDPLGTSAWNTLVSGRKRWLLLPPPPTTSSSTTLVNDQHCHVPGCL